jgi:CMP-2-keto-3-deoxyoctulosonic acid synthetase
MNLAYIQARSGSKRFPKKALALWKGKPMVADAIEKAQATGLFDYIAVSSDDPEVLQIAVDYGVLPLWRSPATASDTATDDDVAREVLRYFPKVNIVCKLYPCIPLLRLHVLRMAAEHVIDSGRSMYSVDKDGVDAGAFYIFPIARYHMHGTISLSRFPWDEAMILRDEQCQDINTPDDLEKAKIKAGI